MKNQYIKLGTFILLAGILYNCSSSPRKEKEVLDLNRPNVIFIFADDLGYGDLSCYNTESRIQTPHLDRLATQGMLFTDAHSSAAVCTPSRYSLLTGRYCWRTDHKRGVQGGYGLPLIEKDRLTIGHVFQKQGYKTATIGKWHVGMEWPLDEGYVREEQEEETVNHLGIIKDGPLDHGFDYYFGTSGCTSDDSPFCFIENRKVLGNPLVPLEGLNVIGDGTYMKDVLTTADWAHEEADTIFTNRAISFMQEQVNGENPFFVYLALSLPHIPWAPAEFVKGTTGAGPRGDLVALVDHCLGEIERSLSRMGIMEKTIVIFSSDNGPREGINGHSSAGPLRGLKGQIYEGGHRVPLIIRWPGRIEPGTITEETVCMTDFMSTFAELLGVVLPENAGEDSYSLLPVMLQKPYDKPFRESTVHHSGAGAFAIRKGDWKMIFGEVEHGEMPGDPATWEDSGSLFNMREDPYETENLRDEYPEVVEEMNALLKSYVYDNQSPGKGSPLK